MIRSTVYALLGLVSVVAIGMLPIACQGGGVGDPCTPEDEYNSQFAGFKVTEENIESRSFQCQTRICLVNHFQGRVSCPLGQATPVPCVPGKGGCASGQDCSESQLTLVQCDPTTPNGGNDQCSGAGNKCNQAGHFCECGTDLDCARFGTGAFCDGKTNQCRSFTCHTPQSCQTAEAGNGAASANKGKACCVPGTDSPISAPVCGQCTDTHRDGLDAVYCSCRCGVAEGQPVDPNFNFCACPTGFECSEIRKDVGLGDAQITGKYCIKTGTQFSDEKQCGKVNGFFDSTQCKGRQ